MRTRANANKMPIPQSIRMFKSNLVSPRAGKSILITGGAGFLGSHLCEKLIGLGQSVVCLDNFGTGRESNIRHLRDHSNFHVVAHDVIVPFNCEVNEIYNLACPASPRHYQTDPIHTMKTCVFGAINLLELARENNATIFQASTSEVYGDPHVHPQHENYWGNVNPIGPRACYDEGKRCAETLLFDYRRQHRVKIKVARIFNTYGPRMRADDGRVVSNFVVQALRGSDLTIHGAGEQTRSFCYVDDLIDGFLKLMAAPSDITGPINLGNPQEFSVRDLADLVIAMTGSKSRIVHLPLPVDDPRQRRPDISDASLQLDWRPSVPLVEGLRRTIAYFDRLLRAEASRALEEVA